MNPIYLRILCLLFFPIIANQACPAADYGADPSYAELEESKLLEILTHGDGHQQLSAMLGLYSQWAQEISDRDAGRTGQTPEKREDEALAPGLRKLVDFLKSKENISEVAARILPFVPPRLANRSVIKNELIEASKASQSLRTRIISANSIRDLFWISGLELDDAAVAAINNLLVNINIQNETSGEFKLLLLRFETLRSDGAPFKDAFMKLAISSDCLIADRAKKILEKLSEKMTPELRKQSASRYL